MANRQVPRGKRDTRRTWGDSDSHGARLSFMSKTSKFLAFLLVIVLAAGGFFIVTWEIPAPTIQVEKTIPDDKFPR